MNGPLLAEQIDRLYQRAVLEPGAIDEPVLVEWSESAFEVAGGDRDAIKAIRRGIRTARKLAKYWVEHDPARLPDWRNGVDEVLGGLGWQAQLDVLMTALATDPDPDQYELVKDRYRQVHFAEWMEQVPFDEWLATQ